MPATIPSQLSTPLQMEDSSFKPWYTPNEMLELGIFGGIYFRDLTIKSIMPQDVFKGIPISKYSRDEYLNSVNYFNVLAMPRNRGLTGLPPRSKGMHPLGWFQWYIQYFYGMKQEIWINFFRMIQWKEELITFSHYLESATYTPPNPNPDNLTKYTDNSFLPEWKQHMLHFGWDCTKKPIDYGIR